MQELPQSNPFNYTKNKLVTSAQAFLWPIKISITFMELLLHCSVGVQSGFLWESKGIWDIWKRPRRCVTLGAVRSVRKGLTLDGRYREAKVLHGPLPKVPL